MRHSCPTGASRRTRTSSRAGYGRRIRPRGMHRSRIETRTPRRGAASRPPSRRERARGRPGASVRHPRSRPQGRIAGKGRTGPADRRELCGVRNPVGAGEQADPGGRHVREAGSGTPRRARATGLPFRGRNVVKSANISRPSFSRYLSYGRTAAAPGRAQVAPNRLQARRDRVRGRRRRISTAFFGGHEGHARRSSAIRFAVGAGAPSEPGRLQRGRRTSFRYLLNWMIYRLPAPPYAFPRRARVCGGRLQPECRSKDGPVTESAEPRDQAIGFRPCRKAFRHPDPAGSVAMSADAASRLTATNLPDDTISARVPGASAPRAPSYAPSASRRPSCCPPERLPGGDGRRPPPPPSGFRPVRLARFGRATACLLAAPLALLLLAAETAYAQAAVKLVGNTGLPSEDFGARVDIALASRPAATP